VTSTENYADVRVGYNDQELVVYLNIFDRRLWYDPDPSPDTLTAWDSVTLYLDLKCNVGNTPTATRFDLTPNSLTGNHPAPLAGCVSRQRLQLDEGKYLFTTESGYRWESASVGGLNNNQNNRGWSLLLVSLCQSESWRAAPCRCALGNGTGSPRPGRWSRYIHRRQGMARETQTLAARHLGTVELWLARRPDSQSYSAWNHDDQPQAERHVRDRRSGRRNNWQSLPWGSQFTSGTSGEMRTLQMRPI